MHASITTVGSALLLLLSACGGGVDPEVRRAAARDRIQTFASTLQGALQQAMQEGGPVAAIEVCHERAPAIAAEVSDDEFTLRRIGTRVRNAATNTPTEAERRLLDEFAALPADRRAAAFHEIAAGDGYAFYAPIFVTNPICLTCHGPKDEVPAPVREALAERYPNDEAFGYAIGDLRGAFVVESR